MKQYTITIEPVESDDFGDKHYKWYAHVRHGENQYWYDYFHKEPTLPEVIEYIKEVSGGNTK